MEYCVNYYSSDTVYIVISQNSPIVIDSDVFPYAAIKNVGLEESEITLGIGAGYVIQLYLLQNIIQTRQYFGIFQRLNKKLPLLILTTG